MIKTEIINARIEKRILVTDAPFFSGETVTIKLDFDCGDASASNHKVVLFGDDKKALAEGTFSADGNGVWLANLNTATNEMAAYFEGVPVDATKSIGAMVINASTADVITRGNVLVVSTPFPDDLSPCPQTFSYLTTDEFSSSVADLESEISGKADSSTVADLSSDFLALQAEAVTFDDLHNGLDTLYDTVSADLATKAESSTVADLASEVAILTRDAATFDDLTNGMSALYAELSSAIADRADASTVADLSSAVGNLETIINAV